MHTHLFNVTFADVVSDTAGERCGNVTYLHHCMKCSCGCRMMLHDSQWEVLMKKQL